ncbi:TraR/DksA C4-type zinc finger protein [Aquiflexum sp. TKW24L]|uniref:TraR/DksA family transcriptional regulator n=1 Tax=Aquiflexum sp. TKW24L TaxID=2942212 RepID=UPI0020BEBB1F|nr:TraR/DksA C4-type zinc finger protein [Aquiflexum sp. TKW24L]MCL6260494.1 TraR/DksA C4-type zinc finger protein [Aquiflexum sp. TKW24L]
MDAENQSTVKKIILDKIIELETEFLSLKEMTKPLGLDSAIGRISRMDYINNKSINEAQIKKIEIKLKALNNWLGKLGSSEFGKCIRCGNEININRLIFLPESNLCINCASRS